MSADGFSQAAFRNLPRFYNLRPDADDDVIATVAKVEAGDATSRGFNEGRRCEHSPQNRIAPPSG